METFPREQAHHVKYMHPNATSWTSEPKYSLQGCTIYVQYAMDPEGNKALELCLFPLSSLRTLNIYKRLP